MKRYNLCDVYEKKFLNSERFSGQKAPVMEAAYGIHENTKLKLYDCMVPKVQEYITTFQMVCTKCRERAKDAGVDNLPISQRQLEIQREIQKSKEPKLEEENKKLKA